jgi:hypothetical protein
MNYLLTHDPLDALSFYVYDVGCILANDIARRPFGKTDRGQTLLFYKFMQSWVGFELVKVLVRFGLQPITYCYKRFIEKVVSRFI